MTDDSKPSPSPNSQNPKGTRTRNIAIAAAVIVVAVLAVAVLASGQLGLVPSNEQSNNGGTTTSSGPGGSKASAPSQVTVSGTVNPTGQGTQATLITFTASNGASYSSPVSSGAYSVALPNGFTFLIKLDWIGQYSWQGGSVTLSQPLSLSVGAGQSAQVTQNLQVPTPPSTVTVSGTVTTLGQGTSAKDVTFTPTSGSVLEAALSSGQYAISLPNNMTYVVGVDWLGQYSWQSGSLTTNPSFQLSVAAGQSASVSADIQAKTPPSVVTVSGTATATGQGTQDVSVIFVDPNTGTSYTATVSNGQYSLQMPNVATYNVQVKWTGQYPWQSGTDSVNGSLQLNTDGPQLGYDITDRTPNSVITVSGTATTTGFQTQPTAIIFTDSQGNVHSANVVGGAYAISLPNGTTYSVQIQWGGLLGSSGKANAGTLSLYEGPGITSYSANWSG